MRGFAMADKLLRVLSNLQGEEGRFYNHNVSLWAHGIMQNAKSGLLEQGQIAVT